MLLICLSHVKFLVFRVDFPIHFPLPGFFLAVRGPKFSRSWHAISSRFLPGCSSKFLICVSSFNSYPLSLAGFCVIFLQFCVRERCNILAKTTVCKLVVFSVSVSLVSLGSCVCVQCDFLNSSGTLFCGKNHRARYITRNHFSNRRRLDYCFTSKPHEGVPDAHLETVLTYSLFCTCHRILSSIKILVQFLVCHPDAHLYLCL